MGKRNSYDDDDINYRETYEPAWLSQPRGFIDMPTKSADDLNVFLDFYLPLMIDKLMSQRRWCFRLADLDVELLQDSDGPLRIAATSHKMPRKYLDGLRADLRQILSRALHEPGSFSGQSLGVMVLQMTEEAESWVRFWGDETAARMASKKTVATGEGWDTSTVDVSSSLFTNPHGVNLVTADDTARFILGKSIDEICKAVLEVRYDPDNEDEKRTMRILHVEPVFRDDLATRFLAKKAEIHQRLLGLSLQQLRRSTAHNNIKGRSKENLAAALAEPSITYHGAPRHVVRSIVRYGFVVPGNKIGHTGNDLDVSCDSSYGVGIYSSPDPESSGDTSSGFVSPAKLPGSRLLVCATLMGRAISVTRDETRRKQGLFIEEADSHVNPAGDEYIVFDPAQILPCYVLHVDWGAEDAKETYEGMLEWRRYFARIRAAMSESRWDKIIRTVDTSPGDLQRQKAALKAAAAKWFPYGYGPYKGSNFVIEEIGEVSDDEEYYGEFQGARQEKENEFQVNEQSSGGGSWFDEYQTVRSSNKQVRLEKQSRWS